MGLHTLLERMWNVSSASQTLPESREAYASAGSCVLYSCLLRDLNLHYSQVLTLISSQRHEANEKKSNFTGLQSRHNMKISDNETLGDELA